MSESSKIYVGTAGWSIPPVAKPEFLLDGSHLERYSQKLNAVEINSAFYRVHQAKTYERWKSETPADFRFSVKLYKKFTHDQKLQGPLAELREVVAGMSMLGEKLSVLLVQLPPSLVFNVAHTHDFFSTLRECFGGAVVVEPRNRTWNSVEASEVFKDYTLSRALVDPDPCALPDESSFQHAGLRYYRLHGSPEIYRSDYSPEVINIMLEKLAQAPLIPKWCIFDNTTFGYATRNALQVRRETDAGQIS